MYGWACKVSPHHFTIRKLWSHLALFSRDKSWAPASCCLGSKVQEAEFQMGENISRVLHLSGSWSSLCKFFRPERGTYAFWIWLWRVVIRAVAKLKKVLAEWEASGVVLNLDNCFLNSARVQPPRCNLTFFPDQGVEIVKESILHSGAYSGLIDILYSGQYVQAGVRTNTEGGRDACGNPALPTKPCRVTNLVCKAYAEAGQAGAFLHTWWFCWHTRRTC